MFSFYHHCLSAILVINIKPLKNAWMFKDGMEQKAFGQVREVDKVEDAGNRKGIGYYSVVLFMVH